MVTITETFNQIQLKKDRSDFRSGDTVRVHQKIKEKGKERVQVFEGVILARKHGKGISATITVRKVISGIGVEKIFPIHSPTIEKIEIVKRSKVRRAKLYYLREAKGKKARLKRKEFAEIITGEEPKKETKGETEEPAQISPIEEIKADKEKPEKEVKFEKKEEPKKEEPKKDKE